MFWGRVGKKTIACPEQIRVIRFGSLYKGKLRTPDASTRAPSPEHSEPSTHWWLTVVFIDFMHWMWALLFGSAWERFLGVLDQVAMFQDRLDNHFDSCEVMFNRTEHYHVVSLLLMSLFYFVMSETFLFMMMIWNLMCPFTQPKAGKIMEPEDSWEGDFSNTRSDSAGSGSTAKPKSPAH